MSTSISKVMNANLSRISRDVLTDNLYAITQFDEFLQSETYLFLRTHNAEGSYPLNEEMSAFGNVAKATSEFIGSTLTADRIKGLQKYWKNSFVDVEPVIVPVHSYISLGKDGNDYVFQLTDNGSNLMSIMSSIVFTMHGGMEIDFGFRQAQKVTRNASGDLHRMTFPVNFVGNAQQDHSYVVFDDHIKTGSTVANLAGHIHGQGGKVMGFMSLSNNPIVEAFKQSDKRWAELQSHPCYSNLGPFWREQFGYGLDGLTDTESAVVLELLSEHGDSLPQVILAYAQNPAGPFYPKPVWWNERITIPEICNLDDLGVNARLIIMPATN